MGRIPDSFIKEVLERNPITDVIGGYVNLKRSSGNYVGLCPFHSEKTPSFTVFPDNDSFYCFGCHAGGNTISFISKIENLSYVEAIKFLAERASMSMPEDNSEDAAASKQRDAILRANREAARFFHACLKDEKLGAEARQYIEKRKLTPETVMHFGIGAAPEGWDSLTKHLRSKGFSDADIVAASLGRYGKSGNVYDFFRNRLMFPIIDLRGNVIAFGGRNYDGSQPKYLNSSETPVFSKKTNLFALNFAKNKSKDRLILAEGYMDVVSMHQAGFTEAVATLGTAITSEQARLMSRYAKKIVVAYDTDAAGQSAVQKATKLLSELNVSINILAVSDGKDPDEFIRENGAEKFEMLIDGAKSKIQYELMMAASKNDITTAEGRVNYLKEAVRIIAAEPYAATREVYTGIVAKQTDVSKDQLRSDISKLLRIKDKKKNVEELKQAEKLLEVPKNYNDSTLSANIVKAEEYIIEALLRNPDYYSKIGEPDESDFVTEKNARIFAAVKRHILNGSDIELSSFGDELESDDFSHLVGIYSRSREFTNTTVEDAKLFVETVRKAKSDKKVSLKGITDDDFRNLIKQKK